MFVVGWVGLGWVGLGSVGLSWVGLSWLVGKTVWGRSKKWFPVGKPSNVPNWRVCIFWC